MRDAGEIAEHHAEAMIERHRNADAVALAQALRLADEKAVVEDVMMRERRTLGGARRAARELDVDGIVELQEARQGGELIPLTRAAHCHDIFEAEETMCLSLPDADQ